MQVEILRNRIKAVLQNYNYTCYKLSADEIERQRITGQINGTRNITAETIGRVLETFPDISAEWLLRGEGNMYKSENAQQVLNQSGVGNSANQISNTDNTQIIRILLAEKDERIKELKERINELKSYVDYLTKK